MAHRPSADTALPWSAPLAGPLPDTHRRLLHLQALTAALAAARTPEDVAGALLREGQEVFGAESSNVYALRGGRLEQLGVAGPQGPDVGTRRVVALDAGLPHCETARTGVPVYLADPEEVRRHYPHLEARRASVGHHAWVSLPLVAGGRVLGAVGLGFARPVPLGPEERSYLELAASISAQALARAAADAAEREAASALREREAQLSAVLDASPASIFVTDLEGRYLRVNPAFARVAGRTPGEMLGRTVEELFPRGTAEVARARMREALERGGPVVGEEQLAGPGGVRTYLAHRTLLRDADGRPSALCAVVTDVTELHRQREALRLTEGRYRLVLRATRDAVWDWDVATDALVWNDEVEHLFGHTHAALGGTLRGWAERVHPDDRARVLGAVHAVLEGAGPSLQVEYRFQRADGQWAHVVDRGHVLRDAGGRALRMVGAVQDVTEERAARAALARSEGQLRSLVEATSQLLWASDARGRATEDSDSWRAFTGQAPGRMLGEGWLEVVHPDDVPAVREAWAAAAASGRRYEVDYRVRRPDGAHTWMCAYGAPVRDAEGRATGEWVGMNLDVSERKRAEEFEQQLVGIVSHDLRNPLSAVRFGTELARRSGPLTEAQGRALARADSAAERALRLVRDLLDFTRARLGAGLQVAPVPLDAHALLEEVVAEARAAHPGRTFAVRTSGAPEARLDPDRVAQLLTNLLANAAAYGDPDSPVTATCEEAGGGGGGGGEGALVLSVHNRGAPIPPGRLSALFEPLVRGEAAGMRAHGIGLGLYIVRELARAHGGRVDVTSSAAGGTCFRVELPRG
jgi:PAS domain S-box-containing protein